MVNYLNNFYEPNHQIILYEASQYSIIEANIQRITLCNLPNISFSKISTLYIPPVSDSEYDEEFIQELNINKNNF